MKKNIKKFIIILNLLLIALPLNLLSAWSTFDKAKAENNDSDPADITENIVPENSDYDGPDDDFADSSGVQVTKMPESVISITNFFDNNYTTNDQYEMSQSGFLWAVENIASDPKLILNPSDLQDIRTLYCLGSVVPDFANHDDALAAASGKTLSQIANLKASNLKDYQALVIQAQESAKKDIVSDLKNDLPNFACIAGVNQNQAADMLKYDPDSVKAIIDNAQNKVVIDRRILELLVNLVTPKNQGGAGHELIKVQRIRNGYNRDAKQNSRESDAIYQQIAEANSVGKSTLNTVGDIASANKDALSNDPTIAGAVGQAEVLDSTGASQGDLIFSDQETASNLSAHYKGEAVDIAAVDNIKCTLIKKKYIGSDTKRKLPATPISLAWQTSSGYDNSPPPDYSSLDANLRQLASGNYLDLIDQLGISVDSSEDLSDSSFSDIVSLIGQSLLGEMLNSPNMAISGTTFADTIKKIGGMALADHLNLPRQAFVDANLADLNDLESKIGEAQIEQKMNLPWGSLRGNNMNDIFTNAGERHVENALHLPENTLNTSITDQNGFLLTVGRRTIEQALSLPASIFDSSTNFSKLEQLGGKRKVDLVYQNPTSVDERLGLGLGDYSRNYKSGSLSPDDYAILVARKALSDNVYFFASSTAASNAARLSVDSTSNSITTATADARMTDILKGQNLQLNFQQIGMDIVSQAFSKESDVRAALSQWFNNKSASTDCAIPAKATVAINIAASNPPQQKNVSLPEDQFISDYGFARGDFYRLFGCASVNPTPVFRNIGRKSLYNSIASSSAAQRAKASFLAQHPEITSKLQTIEFYISRIKTIKSTSDKIKNDWANANNSDPQIVAFKNQISTLSTSLANLNPDSLKSGAEAVNKIREIVVNSDQSSGTLQIANVSDQDLRNKINDTLVDFSILNQSFTEILTGEPVNDVKTLNLSQLNDIGHNNTNSATGSGTKISAASLALMLSGKLSPVDFLISIGGNKIEDSLDLPSNAIFYFSNYVRNRSDQAKIDGKDAFFQAIGQARFEETFDLPPNFFQGETPGDQATLADVRNHVSKVWNISQAEAGAQIMRALDLPGDFSSVASNNTFSAGSLIWLAAGDIDSKLSIENGSTLNFLNGGAVALDTLGSTDAELVAGRLNLPENIITTFARVKSKGENLSDALKQNYTSQITYNSHNGYSLQIPSQSTTNNCPVNFSYTSKNGISFAIGNQITDNSYIYADSSGTHSFPSINEARNYAESNQTAQIDFIEALSQGLASNTGIANSFDQDVAAKYKNQLKDFLSDEKKESAFPYSDMENISNKLSIPNASLKDLLVRKGLVSDLSKKPINPYLEKIGKRTAESRITTALFGSIGITVAGIKIDASDIFDLLSGNGTSVGDKIGSKYMEKQLGTGDNQIINVVQSPSSIIRNCSMANLGANFVGGVLGLGAVSLSGNFYENIGGAKIEKVLNLPSNSFRGGNLNDLMNNVGPVAFARAFELPPANVISSDILSNLSMKSSTKKHSISDQYKLVESKINYLDKNNSSLGSATKINSKLKQNINNLLASNFTNSAPNPYTSDSSTKSVSDFQVANSLSRVNSIDNQFGLPLGITSQLLTGKISPDDYRHLVADTVVTSIPTINNLGGLLGIDPATLTRVDAVANLAQQINFCKFDSCNYTKMYQGFSQIFGLKLDHKLGLRDGSIGQIIASPEKAAATMLLSALNKLDNSLDLNSAGDASFTAVYAGLGGPLPYSDDWCNNTPMKFRETDTITTGGGGFIGGSAHSSDRWQYYGGKIGTQLVGKFLNRIGIIATPSPGSGSYVGKPETQNLILDSTEKLVHGDLRVLEVTAAVKAAEALHFYSDDQGNSKKLPKYYRVSFEDIYYSIMGDPIFEQLYIDKATDNFLSSYQTNDGNPNPNLTPLSSITEDGEMAGSPTDTLYGSQCPPGFTGDDCYLVNPMGPNNSYSTYENLESMANDNASAYPTTAYDPAAVMQSIQSNPEATEALARTQESARRQADDTLHSNLLWRMADAKLYQVDNNIPAGFIKTMYSGNGVQRTIMIVDYLQNALHNVSINGVTFDKAEMGIDIYNQITSFMQDPQSFDLDSLLKNGDLDKFNNWASGKLGNLLGFNLQPGTITSVLYGFKSGSFTNDITVPGVGDQVKSLTTIYKDWAIGKITGWADKALGLPSGSVFTAYSMYRNYAAAREALFAAKNFGSAADVTNARANLDSIKASAIAFVVNLVFSKQIGQFENAIGLVPGTGSMLVTMLISGFNPVSVAIFVLMNLFGVYKTVITCTADGYYPRIDQKPDPTVSDNSSLGTFSGLNPTAKKAGYIQAAQYKNRTLIGDVFSLSERIGDQTAIPSQIMTGRQEDVDYWQYKVDDVICSKVGGCAGTRAGLWVNPQTTGYLHIGF